MNDLTQDWSEKKNIPLIFYDYCNVSVFLKFWKRKPSRQTDKELRHLIHLTFCLVFRFCQLLPDNLDLCKIDKNNQTLLELRNRSVKEKNKLQDAGGEDDANESDISTATEKTLDNDEETTLRGNNEFNDDINDHLWCKSCRRRSLMRS